MTEIDQANINRAVASVNEIFSLITEKTVPDEKVAYLFRKLLLDAEFLLVKDQRTLRRIVREGREMIQAETQDQLQRTLI